MELSRSRKKSPAIPQRYTTLAIEGFILGQSATPAVIPQSIPLRLRCCLKIHVVPRTARKLGKNRVHNSSSKQDLRIRDWYRGVLANRPVECVDQVFHPR